jgi:dTDP-4-dehydrorhamnose reductase
VTSVLVLGGDGMLGGSVSQCLRQAPDLRVISTSRASNAQTHFDATDADGLETLFHRSGPLDYVVNCIGILGADICADRPDSVRNGVLVNALFPHNLAAAARSYGARVIHMSTDGVFAGDSPKPYVETDHCDCDDLYGRTKVIGEVYLPNVLNVRCSVIGLSPRRRRGLLEWFLAQPTGSRLRGYVNHVWNGVTVLQFAQLCREIFSRSQFDTLRAEGPVHHFCPNHPLSKFELLMLFRDVFERDVEVAPEHAPHLVHRVLETIHSGIPALYGTGLPMRDAIQQLADHSIASGRRASITPT